MAKSCTIVTWTPFLKPSPVPATYNKRNAAAASILEYSSNNGTQILNSPLHSRCQIKSKGHVWGKFCCDFRERLSLSSFASSDDNWVEVEAGAPRVYEDDEFVVLEEGMSDLPLLDPSLRATPLTPSQWRSRLTVNKIDNSSNEVNNCILLDVRNGYEWDVGHFKGAQRPDVNCFRSTSYGLSESEVVASDPLAAVDKEKTDILMYCTGGIRCDVYSTILRELGFKNLYTLKGGVSHYLDTEGSVGWVGNLFVFDGRLSLSPLTYKPEICSDPRRKQEVSHSFAKCYICAAQVSELRHRNCANLDCNLLFLCCLKCANDFRGCCCMNCMSAPRLRPVLPGHRRYQKWHNYRDLELQDR